MSKDILFKVNGFEVYADSKYVVKDKPDENAPSGYRKLRVSKLPSDGVTTSFQCDFNQEILVWDTGFYENSPCYRDTPEAEVKQRVTQIKKNLVDPYKKATGRSNDDLAHTNHSFWDRTNFVLEPSKVFDTKNPLHLFELYFSILTGQLTPKGEEGNPRFAGSFYVVVDQTKDTKRKEELAELKFSAIGSFERLLKEDKAALISILRYAKVKVVDSMAAPAIRAAFNEFIEKENSATRFNKIVEEYNSGREANIRICIWIKDNLVRNKKLSKNAKGMITYDGIELGPDEYKAADTIVTLHHDIMDEILLTNDD